MRHHALAIPISATQYTNLVKKIGVLLNPATPGQKYDLGDHNCSHAVVDILNGTGAVGLYPQGDVPPVAVHQLQQKHDKKFITPKTVKEALENYADMNPQTIKFP